MDSEVSILGNNEMKFIPGNEFTDRNLEVCFKLG